MRTFQIAYWSSYGELTIHADKKDYTYLGIEEPELRHLKMLMKYNLWGRAWQYLKEKGKHVNFQEEIQSGEDFYTTHERDRRTLPKLQPH